MYTVHGKGSKIMKIAVASTGSSINSEVDPHTGRARCFVIYDTGKEDFVVYDNWRVKECQHWAGSRAADILESLGVDAIILRNIGPCAFRRLSGTSIGLYQAPLGSRVVEAIRGFREHELSLVEAPNCTGHNHLLRETL